ncbi:right-handed parallel beta-helix repeat-containing protein, partial [Candidatus Woesearchaeota archaeon]|nr:right-handed parallel beta-helix repeat-containing protein [Candidatus Woesearchaeota archaeon]
TATGATPSDYECIFAIAKINDSHVYECDHADATYNVNIKANITVPPYVGCVDLDNESTYQGKIYNDSDAFWINNDTELCQKDYGFFSKNTALLILNVSDLTLNCNSSSFTGDSSYAGIMVQDEDRVSITGCTLSNFSQAIYLDPSYNNSVEDITVNSSQYGILFDKVNNSYIDNVIVYNCTYGIYLNYSNYTNVTGSEISNNSQYGLNLYYSNDAMLDSLVFYNNSLGNARLEYSDNGHIFNLTSDQGGIALNMAGADYWDVLNFTASTIYSSFLLTNSNSNNFTYISASNSGTSGMRIYQNSDNNIVKNSTFDSNVAGMSLDYFSGSPPEYNLIYYNTFTNNGLHASSETALNHFNTTNGTNCGPNCSRGNSWDDILTLDIIDLNMDGFGDSGTAYPYNSTNGGNVNANVTDWGPITTKTLAPSGNITIVGPNGTETTGTRNVFLNLTYNSTIGIDKCRWANDNESNLNSAPWEECTEVTAWLLSDATGNKTVFYQIRDTAGGNITLNDSIIYSFTQDYTPPTAPIVYDGVSGDIDWWNSDTTLHANWFNATDDIAEIYYRYRILENSSCYNNDCNWTDAGTDTSITVTDLDLKENSLYSFEVQAYNPFNLSTSPATSNGTRIDLTAPDKPVINSTTHPDQNTEYAVNSAEFNWTAADILSNGNRSGIEAYSYLLDTHPGTAPDSIEEERYWETLQPLRNNGFAQLLRANSSVSSPHTYAVFSQLHSNFTENESVRVRAALAELVSDYGDIMDISVSLVKVSEGDEIDEFDESDKISNIATISQDIRYAEDMEDAEIYQFNLTVNETVDDNSNDIYVVISGLTSDNDNRHNLSIAGSTSNIDTSTNSFVCNNSNSCANTTASVDYAIEVKKADSGDEWFTNYNSLGDGTYYFHAKAKDKAGNWGDTEHYKIIVAAGGVSISISSPADGEIFTTDNAAVNISVKVFVTGNTSVQVIALHPDGSNYTSASQTFTTTNIFENITLETGQNEIYAIATTAAGAQTISSSVFVTVAAELIPVTNKTLRVVYTGGGATTNHLTYATEGNQYIGIATENTGSVAGGGIVQTETGINTIKIFMSKQFDTADIDDYLEDNEFLDLETPSFSFGKKAQEFVIQNELRYDDVFIGGDDMIPAGKYTIYIQHHGVTDDGRVNLTIAIV